MSENVGLFGEPLDKKVARQQRRLARVGLRQHKHQVNVKLIQGDVCAVLATIPDESVHCVVTSPPYYGLRDYKIPPQIWGGKANCKHEWMVKKVQPRHSDDGITGSTLQGSKTIQSEIQRFPSEYAFCSRCNAWRGSLGLEPTLALYLDHMVEVCREIRRVLRKDGTFWLNIGDSYFGSVNSFDNWDTAPRAKRDLGMPKAAICSGAGSEIKRKDLMLIPSRLAIRLQEDGWWVRSAIVWEKASPMPESCNDRPTVAWEPIFLLTKSANYFYDAEAVKEETTSTSRDYGQNNGPKRQMSDNAFMRSNSSFTASEVVLSRNMRNVWRLASDPLSEAHFATFPQELVSRCVLAGTSEKGVCPKCGAGWVRIVKKSGGTIDKGGWHQHNDDLWRGQRAAPLADYQTKTISWQPSCSCDAGDPVPATVLDPFSGAGTAPLVAAQLGCHAIGIELSEEYIEMSRKRIEGDTVSLGYATLTVE